jgi:hypothetical protein
MAVTHPPECIVANGENLLSKLKTFATIIHE